MSFNDYQEEVDKWINSVGVRYFDVLTNTIILSEEVGEFSKIVARLYGEQSFKVTTSDDEAKEMLKDEMADVFWVLTCLANQMNFDIEEILRKNMDKKNRRDQTRHKDNEKLR